MSYYDKCKKFLEAELLFENITWCCSCGRAENKWSSCSSGNITWHCCSFRDHYMMETNISHHKNKKKLVTQKARQNRVFGEKKPLTHHYSIVRVGCRQW